MSTEKNQDTSRNPLAQVVRAGPFLFVSGQVPVNGRMSSPPKGIEAQTHMVMGRIRDLLAEEGLSLSNIVRTTVYLREISDFEAMNSTYAQYFPTDPPARTTVGAQLAVDALIEVDAIAVTSDGFKGAD